MTRTLLGLSSALVTLVAIGGALQAQALAQTPAATPAPGEPIALPGGVIDERRDGGAAAIEPLVGAPFPWLTALNYHRGQAGLPAATENAVYTAGIELHARYCLRNNMLVHPEDPANPWYTAEGHAAGMSSNLAGTGNVNAPDHKMIDDWMQAPFHAVGMLDPRLATVAFGAFRDAAAPGLRAVAGLDVIRGRTRQVTAASYPVYWPGRDTVVPLGIGQPCPANTLCHWGEVPSPLTSCPGFAAPTGVPLIVQLGSGSVIPHVTASSFGFQEGGDIEHCVFDQTSYTNPDAAGQATGRNILGSRSAVVLIPRQPLLAGRGYTASLTINGVLHRWSFRVEDGDMTDGDGDGLPNYWESQFGLNATSSAGTDGAAGDPDHDGRTNLQEFEARTHPRGLYTRYFAEGSANAFFDTRLALFNPGTSGGSVLFRYLQPGRQPVTSLRYYNPQTRLTEMPRTVPGVVTDFATVAESTTPIVLDRTMWWDSRGYGSHAETSLAAPSTTWYLAEGSTSGPFSLFYLLQNPAPTAVTATVRFLRPFGQPPIERTYTLAPESRLTIPVDSVAPELASTDLSAVITTSRPIIVERAMYLDSAGQPFAAGHESAGVTAPATRWFLAEGATGAWFDLFILVANPSPQPAEIDVDYLLSSGATHRKHYSLPAESRFTIWVDDEQVPAGSGIRPLADVAVSSTVTSTNGVPIIVERTMWWPGPAAGAAFWSEAHNSPGALGTGTRWTLADGEVGGAQRTDTFILIANTSSSAGTVRILLAFEDGTTAARTYPLLPNSRATVNVGADFPAAAGKRFGSVIESLGASPAQIVVERAMYTSPGGALWTAGTNALGTPLP